MQLTVTPVAMLYDGTNFVLLNPTLGSAAYLTAGTSANNLVQLDGTAKLPAVDGSQLINLPGGAGATITQIATFSPSSGTTVDFTSIPSTYAAVLLQWSGLSSNGTSDFLITPNCGAGLGSETCIAIELIVGTAGGPNGGPQMFNTATNNAAGTRSGALLIPLYSKTVLKTYNFIDIASGGGGVAGSGAITSGTGALTGLRAYWGSGASFDAGTITLNGVNY